MRNLSKRVRADLALVYGTGSTTRNGNVIDVRGFDAIAFVVTFGTVAVGAAHTAKVQGGSLADGSDMTDLEGTGYSIDSALGTNSARLIDVGHPTHRYLRVVISKDGSNASTESAVAMLYNSGDEPVTQGATVDAKHVHAPVAGAA